MESQLFKMPWVIACLVAVSAGTAVSLAAWHLFGHRPLSLFAFGTGAVAAHLFLVTTFTIMGENVIEDIVKTVMIGIAALLLSRKVPAASCVLVIAAMSASAANAYTRRLERGEWWR